MPQASTERRRGRRVNVQASLKVRRMGTEQPEPFTEEVTHNISLAGVYFETDEANAFAVNDTVMASVSIPEPKTREFPFTRLAGRSRVVRVEELPKTDPSGRKRVGIAIEFGEDMTALTAIPPRG